MSVVSREFTVGLSVTHPELGEGIVLAVSPTGYVTVFFRSEGQREVPRGSLAAMLSREQEIVASIRPADRASLNKLGLMLEAEQIPLLSSATGLTAAKVDLLPHQVVLTHRVAQAVPRRFLIADEVGLGKTIETALILRELASRRQMQRALMIVPAGLVENWRHELNDTFHLDFEVFGSEGDVTDRKSNAFARHDQLIASIDTLKRPARVARLLESPRYDLIVIDEAHHLTATRSGRKVSKTVNFKLAEALRDHTRDLLLLSATPHQGDHFRFWMLIRLLDPELFTDERDMVDNSHRLNAVVIRRTKAEACARDGSPLFARRQVHSNIFSLAESERAFYEALRVYLTDGYNLAEAQGNAGRGLGFVMTIFQKLAASSFAAVRITLERRLLMLTLHEAMVCEKYLDVDGRDRALAEARVLLRQMYGLSDSYIDQAQAERLLADARLQLLKRLKQHEDDELYSDWEGESKADNEEATAELLVSLALPEERRRIRELLAQFPGGEESKAREIVRGLRAILEVNPREKVVIFTTYLGSIAMLQRAINTAFPQIGVEILRGGDHGAKLAAERRFRHPNGPRVLLCTAAGREGINLQFAHVLFNADLPWNPMDLEQRIGRIHRYGQKYTAQVYNLVAADTIEGKIYLLLEQKIKDIGKAMGKVDENGEVAEDLRAQILGQLSERISYERLYQDGLRDPTLQRTRLELEIAMQNATQARHAVQELFQDLDGFHLDDYHAVDDAGQSVDRLTRFVAAAAGARGGKLAAQDADRFRLVIPGEAAITLTTNRELALVTDDVDLIGLEQPGIARLLREWSDLPARDRALAVQVEDKDVPAGTLTAWKVKIQGGKGERNEHLIWLGVTRDGVRSTAMERLVPRLLDLAGTQPVLDAQARDTFLTQVFPGLLQRELAHRGALPASASYSAQMLAWIEVG